MMIFKSYYFAYIHAIISYGLICWGTSSDIHQVFTLQKKALRSILGMSQKIIQTKQNYDYLQIYIKFWYILIKTGRIFSFLSFYISHGCVPRFVSLISVFCFTLSLCLCAWTSLLFSFIFSRFHLLLVQLSLSHYIFCFSSLRSLSSTSFFYVSSFFSAISAFCS